MSNPVKDSKTIEEIQEILGLTYLFDHSDILNSIKDIQENNVKLLAKIDVLKELILEMKGDNTCQR